MKLSLATRALGRECEWHDTIASTQTRAAELAVRGAGHGLVVWAGEQTAGRGRAGRTWVSGTGSLCASIVLRDGVTAADAYQWSFVAGLAVHDVIAARTALSPLLKWPNDVLVVSGALPPRKVAGVLCTLELTPTPAVIVGIGLNLAFDPTTVDATLSPRATSLAAPNADPAEWLAALLLALEHRADAHVREGARHSLAEVRSRLAFVNEPIEVTTQHGVLRGICTGLTDNFELALTVAGGARHVIAAADVWPIEQVPVAAEKNSRPETK